MQDCDEVQEVFLTEFEKNRAQNIARNNALLYGLGLGKRLLGDLEHTKTKKKVIKKPCKVPATPTDRKLRKRISPSKTVRIPKTAQPVAVISDIFNGMVFSICERFKDAVGYSQKEICDMITQYGGTWRHGFGTFSDSTTHFITNTRLLRNKHYLKKVEELQAKGVKIVGASMIIDWVNGGKKPESFYYLNVLGTTPPQERICYEIITDESSSGEDDCIEVTPIVIDFNVEYNGF
jgi:hypothetical protein